MPSDDKVLFPELSYQLVGCAFDIYNELGYGLPEKTYQKAYAASLEKLNLPYEKEKLVHLTYAGAIIGNLFLDFMVDNKVVVELKVRPRLGYSHIRQVMNYLKSGGYKLAILIYFTKDGVQYRRVLNGV